MLEKCWGTQVGGWVYGSLEYGAERVWDGKSTRAGVLLQCARGKDVPGVGLVVVRVQGSEGSRTERLGL